MLRASLETTQANINACQEITNAKTDIENLNFPKFK